MTDDENRNRLRTTFNAVAERYDRVRPHYPPEVFDDIERLGGLRPGSRVLEVGSGTGRATVELAIRGHAVIAVELGAELAAIARGSLARYPRTGVIVADFERWELPSTPFDAVVSASAFHWIDPAIRFGKAADALAPGGVLAIIDVDHVAGGTEPFFVDVQGCYQRWDPGTEDSLALTVTADVPINTDEIEQSGRFGPVIVRRYEWDEAYSTADYLDLLLTYSGHLALDAPAQAGLIECVRSLIDDRYGGAITKRYLATLRLAPRLA
jgi:SAM-dependent methyltransferase